MKKTIRGNRYDTETATKVATHKVSKRDQLYWVSETLYHTPKGKPFLVGEGGPLTHWGEHWGGGLYGDGAGIRPLTYAQADLWLKSSKK